MTLDWDRLTDQDFEELCYDFLSKNGFENIQWYGKSGNDRGRDITCSKSEIVFEDFRRTTNYLVQCKKWVSRPPEPSDLNGIIAWADAHRPNALLMMVSSTLTGNSKDWLKEIEKIKNYSIYLYEEKNFETFLEKNKEIFVKYFEATKPSPIDSNGDLRQRILLALASKDNLSLNEISQDASISIDKSKKIVQDLTELNFIINTGKKYYLEKTQIAFIRIAELLLNSDNGVSFVASSYANSFINEELISYIESRYGFTLKPEKRASVNLIIRLSPSALYHALFGSDILYKNGYSHLKSLKLPKEEEERWTDSFPDQFIMEILRKLLDDFPRRNNVDLLEKEKIDGYFLKIELRMANQSQQLLNVSSQAGIMLLKAQGKIEAGQLLSATDPDLFIKTGDILSNLGLDDKAIENYNLAISKVKEPEKLKAAYNNKGVTLMRIGNTSEAISCFEEALKIDPSLKQATDNKQECMRRLSSTPS